MPCRSFSLQAVLNTTFIIIVFIIFNVVIIIIELHDFLNLIDIIRCRRGSALHCVMHQAYETPVFSPSQNKDLPTDQNLNLRAR